MESVDRRLEVVASQVLQRIGNEHAERGQGVLSRHGETSDFVQVFWTRRRCSNKTGNRLIIGNPEGVLLFFSFL